MSWIIDEFKVKPTGFLAAWRYKRVLVDDNGNITNEDVPGQPDMNLPCIADYRKTNRRYSADALITTFCNRTTFTNYRVYAQDCEPFAYVQTDLNFPACGYLVALPTPGAPVTPSTTNPVVTPVTYGLYRHYNDCDVDFQTLTINFYKKNYSGASTLISKGAESPVLIRYDADQEIPYGGIRSSSADVIFNADSNFQYEDFYTNDEREFRVDILLGGVLKYRGYVIPDSCQQPFNPAPYAVTIRLTDGLGALKNITYPIPFGSRDTLRQSFINILSYCLYSTNLELEIQTVCNLYANKMLTGLDDDPLAQSTVNPLRLSDGRGNIMDCYTVLDYLCKQFSGYISQVDGKWLFQRIAELPNEVIRKRTYDENGLFMRGENVTPQRTAGQDEEIILINNAAEISMQNAYKRVSVLLKFGNVPSVLFNGDFESWDGSNFTYWTKYGGINTTRVQRTVKGSAGTPIDIDDYAVQFNEIADSGKYFQQENLSVNIGDKITFTFLVGPVTQRNMEMKVRIKVGTYYLYNDITSANPDRYEWVEQLASATLYVQQNSSPVNYGLDLPEIPVTGSLVLQLFGFQRINIDNTNTYAPIWVDNITLDKNSSITKKGIDGLLSVSDQQGFYSDRPETIDILFGDFDPANGTITRPDRVVSPANENNLYAIYTADKSYSTGWTEYGMSATPVPIGLANARSILKSRYKPIRMFSGSFQGDNLSYSDIYSITVDGEADFSAKKFAIVSGTFDLKFKQLNNAMLIEIGNKNIVTNDLNTPHFTAKDGIEMRLPDIVQNQDNQSQTGIGIFTEQFTQEFS